MRERTYQLLGRFLGIIDGWDLSPTGYLLQSLRFSVHPKLRNSNLHNITHFLISQNPRERMFVVQISLFLVTFLSLMSQYFVINANYQRSQPTPLHCAKCQYVECHLLGLLVVLVLMSLVECWCTHMAHRPGRPNGVDHTNGGERRMNSNSIVSHPTLIL